jgi:hypothetical protein
MLLMSLTLAVPPLAGPLAMDARAGTDPLSSSSYRAGILHGALVSEQAQLAVGGDQRLYIGAPEGQIRVLEVARLPPAGDYRVLSAQTIALSTLLGRIRHLPAGAAAVRIRADAGAGEISPRVKISKGDALVSSGSARGPEGTIEVPLDPATEAIRDARVCVSNAGREALLLYGERKRAPGGFRYRYGVTFLEDGSSSFLTRADVVSRRFHNGQAGALGAWAMWLALALGVAAGALALALQLRVSR